MSLLGADVEAAEDVAFLPAAQEAVDDRVMGITSIDHQETISG